MLAHELLVVNFWYINAENSVVSLQFLFDHVAHFRDLFDIRTQDRWLILSVEVLRFQLILLILTLGVL